MQSLTPLNDNLSLDRLAYEKIKEAILNFHFLPNQALVESELATQLGISKTPVRDALMRLEKENLVSRIPYKGTYVSDISNQEMVNIFQIRIELEGLAIQLATPNLQEEDFVQMEKLVEAHAAALAKRNIPLVSQINSQFHNTIIQRCSNPMLIDLLLYLDDHLKRYRLLSISQGFRLDKSVPEHSLIINALRNRDAEKAEEAIRTHLANAMHDLYNQNFTELVEQLHEQTTNPV
ncbi:MAG: GntR family transcriptional regulator [Anaerolineaceae bacterium]|jgi:DNA-binding GntR family transcriptional regulator|nr:GntR family transcriptional regulator [Anaerolineaceae bacterium]